MRLKTHYVNYKEIESNEGNRRILNILVQNLNLAFEFGLEHTTAKTVTSMTGCTANEVNFVDKSSDVQVYAFSARSIAHFDRYHRRLKNKDP